eukprot:7949693-Pyramimonas_sp.AAC.2
MPPGGKKKGPENMQREKIRSSAINFEAARLQAESDQKRLAAAWDRLKGHADEQIRNNALAARAVSEENRRLRSDLEQDRTVKESQDKARLPGQPATESLSRAGYMTTALPAEVGPKGEFGSTPAQRVHVVPPPHPIAARPVCKRDNMRAQTRTGNPSQICHLYN